MSPDTVLRQHGLGASKKWTRAIHGFAAHLNGNQADKLEQDTRVLYVEPDATVNALAQTLPTGVRRIGCTNNAAWIASSVTPINADIAIIDTGIDLTHPDLNVYANTTFVTGTTTGNDDNGHGTHCAGIAAARNNAIGVVGVAPGARLWAVKVLDSTGSGSLSTIISGVDYVTQHAAEIEVANLSLGGQGSALSLQSAIQTCVASGVVVVVAAGNSAYDIYGPDHVLGTSDDFFPAAFPECMTVSALADSDGIAGGVGAATAYGSDDTLASFSNYSQVVDSSKAILGVVSTGGAIDLAAPGVAIYSTYKGGTYATMSGTSMACPHAAGAVALYTAQYGRAANAAQVYAIRQAIINAVEPMAAWGVNAPNPHPIDTFPEGLAHVSNFAVPQAFPNIIISCPPPNLGMGWNSTVLFSASAVDATDGDISATKLFWSSSKDGILGGPGATLSITANVNITSGTHTIIAYATNSLGNVGRAMSKNLVVDAVPGTTPPTVAITSPVDGSTVASTTVVTFTGTATDPVDGNVAYKLSWASSLDGYLGQGASFTNFLSAGAHTIVATVTNAAGLIGSHSHSLTVTGTSPPPANLPPVVTILQPANGLSIPAGTSLTCVGTATDSADGDLSASIVWSDNLSGGLGKGASATFTPAAGSHVVTAQVADSAGAVTATTVTFTVTSAGTPLTVSVAANKAAYVNKEKALLTTTVTSGGTAVSGATVTVQVRSGSRSVATKTGTTTSAGTFAFYLPIQKSKYGTGAGPFTATVVANASKTGSVSGTSSTTYLVY